MSDKQRLRKSKESFMKLQINTVLKNLTELK